MLLSCMARWSATPPLARPSTFTHLPGDQGPVSFFSLHSSAPWLLGTRRCQERVSPKPSFLVPGRTSATSDLLCCHHQPEDGVWTPRTATACPSQETGLAPSQKTSRQGGRSHCGQQREHCQEPEVHGACLSHSTDTAVVPSKGSFSSKLHWQHSTSHTPNLSLCFNVMKQFHRLQIGYSFKIKCTSTKTAALSNIYRETFSAVDLMRFFFFKVFPSQLYSATGFHMCS